MSCGSYLGTIYDFFFFLLLNKLYMIHLTERYMFNNNSKTREALQRHMDPFMLILFNLDLNRGCLVYMFSLRFSGSKFFINLRRQFRVRKIFVHKFLRNSQSFHFVFKITISKMRNLVALSLNLAH